MGDEADRLIDDGIEDFYSFGGLDESKEVRCKHCRERDLYWTNINGKPVLVDENRQRHVCKPSADDFEMIE